MEASTKEFLEKKKSEPDLSAPRATQFQLACWHAHFTRHIVN
jgi:hypothetical protein